MIRTRSYLACLALLGPRWLWHLHLCRAWVRWQLIPFLLFQLPLRLQVTLLCFHFIVIPGQFPSFEAEITAATVGTPIRATPTLPLVWKCSLLSRIHVLTHPIRYKRGQPCTLCMDLRYRTWFRGK